MMHVFEYDARRRTGRDLYEIARVRTVCNILVDNDDFVAVGEEIVTCKGCMLELEKRSGVIINAARAS